MGSEECANPRGIPMEDVLEDRHEHAQRVVAQDGSFRDASDRLGLRDCDGMAVAAVDRGTDLICPMIDARRMEIFTAIYNKEMETVVAPCAMILEENSFTDILNRHRVLFFGNGSMKYKKMVSHKNAHFETIEANALQLIKISNKRLVLEDFNSVAYTEPMYIKNFYSSVK